MVCWKTCKWMREYLCTYVITILLQQMTSYRENSCRFLPWSRSFLFCLKDFLPRLQMTEFLLRWRSCSCFSLFYFMAVLLKSGLHCFLKASSLVIMVSTFSESVRQWKPWSAKLVYSTLFAPDKSWDNLRSSSVPHTEYMYTKFKNYITSLNLKDLKLRALSSTIKYLKYLISEEKI